MSTYDPNRSSAGTDTIADWCRAESVSASDDITTVPGVGPSFKGCWQTTKFTLWPR